MRRAKKIIHSAVLIIKWLLNYNLRMLVKHRHYPIKLHIPTYEHTGQIVHPCVAYFPGKWNGFCYWMAFTPFAKDNDQVENPSIVASNDGINWLVPHGLINPIVPTPGTEKDYNSDPHIMVYDNVMYMIYREYIKSVSPSQESWYILSSLDGVKWSEPIEIFASSRGPVHVSPCMVHDGEKFRLYFITAGLNKGNICMMTCHGDPTAKGNWSDYIDLPLEGFDGRRQPWHLEVYLQEEGTWEMLLNTSTSSSGSNTRLHYAYSEDGMKWHAMEKPLIQPLYHFENHKHYKASMLQYEHNSYKMWYSARDMYGNWRLLLIHMIKKDKNIFPSGKLRG